MKIHVVSPLPWSREQVFTAYRDHLPDMVQYLPNIQKIEVAKRTEATPGVIALENHWYGRAEIPKAAQSIIKPELLRWIDRATWYNDEWRCDWQIELFFLKEAVSCRGEDTFKETGPRSCEMVITGDLSIDLHKVPGIPSFLVGSLQPQIEKFIVSLITPNFHTVNQGISRYLAQKASQTPQV